SSVRDVPIPTRPAPTSTRTKLLSMGAAVVVVLLLALGVYQVMSMRSTSAGAPVAATLSIESSPTGAAVTIDGAARGNTPLRLELTEGQHALDVSLAGATRHVPLNLAGGTITAHSFEFAAPPAAVVADAAIEIRSEPAGGRVLVDGVARGTTPIVVTGLTAGRHEVQVGGPFPTVTKTVTLAAKQQLRFVVTPARTASTTEPGTTRPTRASADTGFITIQSPIVLRIVRNGDFVGTSEDSRLSLPIGHQVIGLENESVGFRDVRTVEVIAGKVTPVPVTLPKGEISVNARPWAEVFIDGARVGETPVSQYTLPVGIHEIVFRHPELGERRVSVVVKIGATGRAFTDFTK
ncbi:MAG: PEGA domain-containing protein, partial [Vicinamibacteraceae bacterium]